jgi:hypothetical protein
MKTQIRFADWRPAREGGSPWRRVVAIESVEHLGEAEACLSTTAARALAEDLGRPLGDDELATALMSYAEDDLRARLEEGEDLSNHSLIIEIDSADRDALRPYLEH